MREIVNSERIGGFVKIRLPGFDGKGETCSVHYLEADEREEKTDDTPLLLVPSAGQSLYTFREIMPALSKSFRCVAIDLPGAGFSSRPQSLSYSAEEMAECILLIMDALGLETAHAAGASFGAAYLALAAATVPKRFGKLTLFCPGGLQKTHPPLLRAMAAPVIGPLAREAYTLKSYGRALKTAWYDHTRCTDGVIREYYRSADDYASRQALMYAVRNMDGRAALENAGAVPGDIFILWGGEDRWSPKENMAAALDCMPAAYRYVVENAGHFFWEEKGAFTADAVERFIRYERREEEEEEDADGI